MGKIQKFTKIKDKQTPDTILTVEDLTQFAQQVSSVEVLNNRPVTKTVGLAALKINDGLKIKDADQGFDNIARLGIKKGSSSKSD